MNNYFNVLILSSFLSNVLFAITPPPIDMLAKEQEKKTYQVRCVIPIAADDMVYADSIEVRSNNPQVHIEEWKTEQDPECIILNGNPKSVFKNRCTIICMARCDSVVDCANAYIEFSYYRAQSEAFFTSSIALSSVKNNTLAHNLDETIKQSIDIPDSTQLEMQEQNTSTIANDQKQGIIARVMQKISGVSSFWIKLIAIFLLGILMSLTPCIYPMIPITAGILQSQGKSSLAHNVLLSFCYILGIALTFAILGMGAAFAGQTIGSLFEKWWFVIILILFLLYMAGSMLGLYELYIPRFMQSRNSHAPSQKSLFSVFLFGAASGTIASPCLSPGLVLLLSIITKEGDLCRGFLYLFIFGIGLGLPLLIIGSFTASLAIMPRAGMWMIDVKRFFWIFTVNY